MESQLEFPKSAILTPYNYFEWKPKIQLHLRSRGLFRITMETEVEPTSAIEKSRYFNRMDEAFGILCLSISPELLFHVESCSTPNEVWKILEGLFGKQDEIWQSFLFSLGHSEVDSMHANEDRSLKFDEDISHAPVDEVVAKFPSPLIDEYADETSDQHSDDDGSLPVTLVRPPVIPCAQCQGCHSTVASPFDSTLSFESTSSLSSVSSSPQLSLFSPAPSAFGRTLPDFDGNTMASTAMQLQSFFSKLPPLMPGDHVWANTPNAVGSQRPEIFRPPWSANWGDPIPSYNRILPAPSLAHQFTISYPLPSPGDLGVPLSPNGLFSPLPALFPSPRVFFPMGPDLFWLVAWKPEKPDAVGDVIQKPMIRASALVTNVLADENYM